MCHIFCLMELLNDSLCNLKENIITLYSKSLSTSNAKPKIEISYYSTLSLILIQFQKYGYDYLQNQKNYLQLFIILYAMYFKIYGRLKIID